MDRTHFTEDQLQRVRQETDIVSLVSNYISLKKSGQNWVGLCPFHSEKSPSFTVSAAKLFFHCFGCGAGGDAIGFVMKMDGLVFPQAVKLLGGRLGIRFSEGNDRAPDPSEGLRDHIHQMNRDASAYFREALLKRPEAERARKYLDSRGITGQTIEAFHLGYALPGWIGLQQDLVKKGWTPELIEKAGLIIQKESPAGDRKHYYDRFRDRVMFPIHDLQRRVIGFGGRVIPGSGSGREEAQPKYLNSPETAVFSKGRHLYALEKAREAAGKNNCLIVVEGYFDAIAAHQAGIQNVAATLGTALTAEHLQRIHRFVPAIKLIFDSDEAGIRAALRTLEMIVPSPVSGEVVLLPPGDDPDSFIKNRGPEAFQKLLIGSVKLLDFAIDRGLSEPGSDTIDGKLRIVDRILPVIRRVSRPIERSYYVKHLSERLGLDERELTSELAGLSDKPPVGKAPPVASAVAAKMPQEEQILLHLLIHHPEMTQTAVEVITPAHFMDVRLQRIYQHLVEAVRQKIVRPESLDWPELVEPELVSVVSALLLKEPDYDDPQRTLSDCLRVLRVKNIRAAMNRLETQIREAEKTGDGPRVRSLQGELIGLKRTTLEAAG
ncbi:MAG TPA: DNA primase [Nitrospiria bacterium]